MRSPTASCLICWYGTYDSRRTWSISFFNSCEKRLARTLLLLAQYGKQKQPQKMLTNVSQGMLAEMIGTSRPRVNFFMTKFRKMGFIKYNGGLQINRSLLSVVLHD